MLVKVSPVPFVSFTSYHCMVPSNLNRYFLWAWTLNPFTVTEVGEAVEKVPELKTQSKCFKKSHLTLQFKATMPAMCFCLSVIRGRADKMGLGRHGGRAWRAEVTAWSYDGWNPLLPPPRGPKSGRKAPTGAATRVWSALKLGFIYQTQRSPLLHGCAHFSASGFVQRDHARNVLSYKRDVKPSDPLGLHCLPDTLSASTYLCDR